MLCYAVLSTHPCGHSCHLAQPLMVAVLYTAPVCPLLRCGMLSYASFNLHSNLHFNLHLHVVLYTAPLCPILYCGMQSYAFFNLHSRLHLHVNIRAKVSAQPVLCLLAQLHSTGCARHWFARSTAAMVLVHFDKCSADGLPCNRCCVGCTGVPRCRHPVHHLWVPPGGQQGVWQGIQRPGGHLP